MAGHYDGPLDKPIEDIYPFQDLPDGSLLIDIGGGNGQQAIRLASKFPQIFCVIQDHGSTISHAEKSVVLPAEVADRIHWEAHDYHTTQPRRGATVYLLSHVLMDNSDAYVSPCFCEAACLRTPT